MMEFDSAESMQGKVKSSSKTMTENPIQPHEPSAGTQKVRKIEKHVAPRPADATVDVNMEASVSTDEVIRAGGFGATDSISSFLPVGSDSSDFEVHLRDIQDYEDLDSNPPEKIQKVDPKDVVDFKEREGCAPEDGFGEVNMEASITSDEVTRAGGFGATDDISSFLPVASDFTDFEAHMRDARDYEDSKEEVKRPGLGWNNESK